MAERKSTARQAEKSVTELSGATRETAEQGADFARDVAGKAGATANEAAGAAEEIHSTFTGNAVDFHRQWIEMVQENTNARLAFAHRLVSVKSPSEFAEVSVEHACKRFETFAEQARQLTGMAQKITVALAVPMRAGMKNPLNEAA
jgi:hypothetical protein